MLFEPLQPARHLPRIEPDLQEELDDAQRITIEGLRNMLETERERRQTAEAAMRTAVEDAEKCREQSRMAAERAARLEQEASVAIKERDASRKAAVTAALQAAAALDDLAESSMVCPDVQTEDTSSQQDRDNAGHPTMRHGRLTEQCLNVSSQPQTHVASKRWQPPKDNGNNDLGISLAQKYDVERVSSTMKENLRAVQVRRTLTSQVVDETEGLANTSLNFRDSALALRRQTEQRNTWWGL